MGQRVFATGRNTGSYAEFLVSESSYVFPLHERLSFAQGCYSMDISFLSESVPVNRHVKRFETWVILCPSTKIPPELVS